jgi:sodium transport system permease protein
MKKVGLIFRKELLDAIRDTRTFLLAVITPLVLYPLLFIGMGYFIQIERTREKETIYKIGIINPSCDSSLFVTIRDSDKFNILTGKDAEQMFEKEGVKAVLEMQDNESSIKVIIHYDGANKSSQNAMKRVKKIVSEHKKSRVKNQILEHGLSEQILEPISIEEKNIAGAKKMGGFVLGTLIPYLLIIVSFSGATHTAIDITAGEKERKTIETLLVTDTKRSEIVIGKTLTVFIVSLLATISGLLGLVGTFYSGFSILGETSSLFVPLGSCLLMLIVMLPLLWFFSSILVAIGSNARTMKEAEMYGSYLSFCVIILAVFSVIRLTSPADYLFFVPVLNTAIAQQQILIGEIVYSKLIITISISIIFASIAFLIAKNNFEKENILFRN